MDAVSVASGSKASRSYAEEIVAPMFENVVDIGAPGSPAQDVPDMMDDIFAAAIRSSTPNGAASASTPSQQSQQQVRPQEEGGSRCLYLTFQQCRCSENLPDPSYHHPHHC
jgi:hypothetical protein